MTTSPDVDATHLTLRDRAPYSGHCSLIRLQLGSDLLAEAIEAIQAKLIPPNLEEGFSRITVVPF